MPIALLAFSGLSDSLQQHPLAAVGLLFAAGLVTSLSPCIWPMIPITIGLLGGTARSDAPRSRVVGLTLTYILGLALFYSVSSTPWVRFAVGNLLIVFALAMLDVIPLRAPQRLTAWAGNLGAGSYPAVFLLGATSGIVAAPCGAPAFGAVLTWVATTRSGVLGFFYLFVFSLGMTAVLAVVGVFSGTLAALPKPGPWMVWIKRAAAVVLLLVAEYYFIQLGKTL